MKAQAKTPGTSVAQFRSVPPTSDEASEFVDSAERRLLDLWIKLQRAQWVQETFITADTEEIAAEADEAVKGGTSELAAQAHRYEGLDNLPEDTARKLKLLKLSVTIPAPRDPELSAELSQITASLPSEYGRAKWYPYGPTGECLSLNDLENILAESRDPNELLRVWEGWHSLARPMRQPYKRMVELANQGATEMGFPDVGALWRSTYDMPSEAFAAELDRLWQQVRPLYLSLHAYMRWKLVEKYGTSVVRENAPIPAHLLGNMWAQSWGNVYPLAAPPDIDPGYDLTKILTTRKIGPVEMVRFGERFFLSLGFAPLPKTFWERSMFTRPKDRDVVCHASAWDIDYEDDLRIKMCIEPTAEDFSTIHHELGHSFYQRAYDTLPPLFRNSANDGFHEAIGDTIALSVTPEYLNQIGLLESVPPASADIGLLLIRALDKVAFLPFGLLIDKWRWGVFSGQIPEARYNTAWWDLRREYQGVAPPVERTEEDFDPGAKYHVAGNVPYARYFLAAVLQFQFHRALCHAAGYRGPLHRGSIYNNKTVGAELNKMLEMGQSRPWPQALEALTGETQMDATAMLDYFAPLKRWLDEQNKGHVVGW
jgi:peptidyl-dipeptidase A